MPEKILISSSQKIQNNSQLMIIIKYFLFVSRSLAALARIKIFGEVLPTLMSTPKGRNYKFLMQTNTYSTQSIANEITSITINDSRLSLLISNQYTRRYE